MKSALIGFTGFVGANIESQFTFTDKYNSKNIGDIDGNEYEIVVSAANGAEMWRINQEPEQDLANINAYIDHLKTVKTKKLVLISTVGVYKRFIGIDEDTPIETEGLLPYGAHRYYLEQYCQDNFDALIVRLPGLYGPGLKKNVIYDLIHNNNVDRIHQAGRYQYYNLDNIWKDINIALDNNLKQVNFATEPVSTKELAKECFNLDFTNEPPDVQPANFDMRTKSAAVFGGYGGYMYSKQEELRDIKSFVEHEREIGAA